MRAMLRSIVVMSAMIGALPSFAQEQNPGDRLLEQKKRREQLEGLARSKRRPGNQNAGCGWGYFGTALFSY